MATFQTAALILPNADDTSQQFSAFQKDLQVDVYVASSGSVKMQALRSSSWFDVEEWTASGSYTVNVAGGHARRFTVTGDGEFAVRQP